MTNARPLAIAELKLADLARQISNTAHSFDTDRSSTTLILNILGIAVTMSKLPTKETANCFAHTVPTSLK